MNTTTDNAPTTRRRRSRKQVDRSGLPFAAYVRVSTAGQARDGVGLDAQRAALEAWAVAQGVALVVYEDAGVSGSATRRPGLDAALAAVDAGECAGLVVSKLDRLGRRTVHLLELAEQADHDGWRLVALDLALDTATPAGRLVLSVLAAMAEFERERIAERQREKFHQLRREGRVRGAKAADRELADRVVAMRDEGATYQAVADALMAEGIPTPAGGTTWHPSSVRSVYLTRSREREAQAEG